MSLGRSQGGLPPDNCVEDEAFILKDSRRVIEQYHDPNPGAMRRIVLAPSSLFAVTPDLMRETARLARAYGVGLHTHLAETLDEQHYVQERFNMRPVDYLETLDWVGREVWFAHSVHVNDAEIGLYARTGCGVAHCPSSNMRLASGVAPVQRYRAAGVKVGLGVDGSASNDSNDLLAEARMAMLLARLKLALPPLPGVADPPDAAAVPGEWLTAREALELATRGGAAVLGRDDIGVLAPGKCADFFALDLGRLAYAGALHDPVAAVVFCAPQRADYTVINGRFVVKEGELTTVDAGPLVERHNRLARELAG
jgi:cytosine/adenosine deaminase-related metal-dependent hydrolase